MDIVVCPATGDANSRSAIGFGMDLQNIAMQLPPMQWGGGDSSQSQQTCTYICKEEGNMPCPMKSTVMWGVPNAVLTGIQRHPRCRWVSSVGSDEGRVVAAGQVHVKRLAVAPTLHPGREARERGHWGGWAGRLPQGWASPHGRTATLPHILV